MPAHPSLLSHHQSVIWADLRRVPSDGDVTLPRAGHQFVAIRGRPCGLSGEGVVLTSRGAGRDLLHARVQIVTRVANLGRAELEADVVWGSAQAIVNRGNGTERRPQSSGGNRQTRR